MAKGWSFGALTDALKSPAFTDFGTNVGATMKVGTFGIGSTTLPITASLDLANYPFVIGERLYVKLDNITNMPAEIKFAINWYIRISVLAASDLGVMLYMEDANGLVYTAHRRGAGSAQIAWNISQLLTAYGGSTWIPGKVGIGSTLTVNGQTVLNNTLDVGGASWVGATLSIGQRATGNFARNDLASINVGDSDSGLVGSGDGVLDLYCNNTLTARFQTNYLRVYGPVVSENADAFRIRINNNKSVIHRWDGTNYYLLVTNDGDPDGTWNGLRPFYFNGANGAVTMGHGVTVGGGFTVNNNAQVNGDLGVSSVLRVGNAMAIGNATYQGDGNINGSAWGGYLSNYIANQINNSNGNINLCAQWVRTGAANNFGAVGSGQLIIGAGWVMIGLNSANGQQNSSINLIGGRLQIYRNNGGWVDSAY